MFRAFPLTYGFWLTLALMALLWVLTPALGLVAEEYRSAVLFGFPLPFYAIADACEGQCNPMMAWPILLFDFALLLGVPLLANGIILLYRRRVDRLLHRRRRTDKEQNAW